MIIDIHTHAWPDKVSLKARENLEAHYTVKFCGDPTVETLLRFMDQNSIDVSVICAVASRPDQVVPINNWLFSLKEPRIKYFCAMHPQYRQWKEELKRIRDKACGIKLQPSFQEFFVDDEKVFPVYEEIEKLGLCLLFHSGDELTPEMIVRATPERLLAVREKFPDLLMIAAHFGGFRHWEGVKKYLLGKNIYFDTSAFFGYLPEQEARELILNHPSGRILFGTDFPIRDQKEDLDYLDKLGLAPELKEKILGGNARELLGF
jgi:predicted TIM-barrel fold metal-dependent hydrolase